MEIVTKVLNGIADGIVNLCETIKETVAMVTSLGILCGWIGLILSFLNDENGKGMIVSGVLILLFELRGINTKLSRSQKG